MTDKWLDELQAKWDAAPQTPAQSTSKKVYKIPAGTDHEFHIVGAEVILTPEKQTIRWDLVVRSYKNWKRTKYTWLGGDPQYAKRELDTLGLNPVSLTELPEAIKDCVGLIVKGTVRDQEGKDYQNFYFNKAVGFEPVGDNADNVAPFVLPDENLWDDTTEETA